MSHIFDSSKSATVEESSDHAVVAKLRRLKIQESLELKNINKFNSGENGEDTDIPLFYNVEVKHFGKRIKNAFSEINNLFEDIKAETEEKFSCLDINNVKKDVMKLDDKIRMLKNYVQSELVSVLSKEEELNKMVNEVEDRKVTSKFKSKIKTKPFNNIVPSPVKVLINSPSKCKEVQEFQEFMTCSPNRYGGWDEYHHNIFVQVWQKYYNTHIEDFYTEDAFQSFTKDDIIRHQEWYSKYLYLKEQQQNALNKWRTSKGRQEKAQHKYQSDQKRCFDKVKSYSNETSNADNEQLTIEAGIFDMDAIKRSDTIEITSALSALSFEDEDSTHGGKKDIVSEATSDSSLRNTKHKQRKRSFVNILKPTEQWSNRCNSSRHSVNEMYNIECVTKLKVPDWRLTLQN